MAIELSKKDKQVALAEQYTKRLEPLVDDAKRAYGARDQNKSQHRASRAYTELLVEYYEKGGSIQLLAEKLGVTYAGIRRRIVTAENAIPPASKRKGLTEEEVEAAIERVKDAKNKSPEKYHAAIAKEREAGIPLSAIARGLGISNAAPLYYGLQRHYSKARSQATAR